MAYDWFQTQVIWQPQRTLGLTTSQYYFYVVFTDDLTVHIRNKTTISMHGNIPCKGFFPA